MLGRNVLPTLTLIVSITLLPDLSSANAREDLFGAGARMKGMAGAGTASDFDASGLYYNPGNLGFIRGSSLSLEISQLGYGFEVEDDEEFPSVDPLRSRTTVNLGMTMPLPFNMALGAMINVGTERIQFFDQSTPTDQPRFGLYGQQLEQLSLMIGLAYRVFDQLAFGVTVAPLVNSALGLDSGVPIYSGEDEVQSRYAWNLEPSMTYYIGMHYRPVEDFEVGLTYRTVMFHKLQANADIVVDLTGAQVPMNLVLESFAWYSPRQISLGFFSTSLPFLHVSADITWMDWSEYPGPYVTASPEDDSALAESLIYADDVEVNFRDTFIPRLGLEWLWESGIRMRMGYRYQASPAPLPDARKNLLDGATHFGSFGFGYAYEPALTYGGMIAPTPSGAPFIIRGDVYATVGYMPEQVVAKDAEVESLRNYSFGGYVYEVGVGITSTF